MPTSWIYTLNKPKLIEELENRNIQISPTSTVEELRKQLAQVVKIEDENFQDCKMGNEYELKEFDKAISRWEVQFDTTGDAVEFLEKIEELVDTLKINKDRIIHVMPRCLNGKASLWYRNNVQSWKTWEDFIENFKLYYYPRNYEKKLLETIINRRQRTREKFIDYLTEIQTLIRRYGKLTQEEQLERIYDNMTANYHFYIRRRDFGNITELIQLARDYEKINLDRYRETYGKTTYHREENRPTTTGTNLGNRKPEPKAERKPIQTNYDPQTCCWKCGKKNHASRECRGRQAIFCSKCGLTGKLTRDCCKKTGEQEKRKPQAYTTKTQTTKDNRMFIDVQINGKKFNALIDTGSTNTYINEEIMKQVEGNMKTVKKKPNIIKLADGSKIGTDTVVKLQLEINGQTLTHQVIYMPATTVMIIGMDLLARLGLTISWKEKTCGQTSTEELEVKDKGEQYLAEEQRKSLQTILKEEFDKAERSPKGNTWTKHVIKLKHREPVKQRYYPRNPVCTTEIEEEEWYRKKLNNDYETKLNSD